MLEVTITSVFSGFVANSLFHELTCSDLVALVGFDRRHKGIRFFHRVSSFVLTQGQMLDLTYRPSMTLLKLAYRNNLIRYEIVFNIIEYFSHLDYDLKILNPRKLIVGKLAIHYAIEHLLRKSPKDGRSFYLLISQCHKPAFTVYTVTSVQQMLNGLPLVLSA